MIISASSFFASSIALSKAFISSGFGLDTFLKSPSGFSCSGTTKTLLNPLFANTFLTYLLPQPLRGV